MIALLSVACLWVILGCLVTLQDIPMLARTKPQLLAQMRAEPTFHTVLAATVIPALTFFAVGKGALRALMRDK